MGLWWVNSAFGFANSDCWKCHFTVGNPPDSVCWKNLKNVPHRIHGTGIFYPTSTIKISHSCRLVYCTWMVWVWYVTFFPEKMHVLKHLFKNFSEKHPCKESHLWGWFHGKSKSWWLSRPSTVQRGPTCYNFRGGLGPPRSFGEVRWLVS